MNIPYRTDKLNSRSAIRNPKFHLLLPIAYMLFIFILSSIPADLGNGENHGILYLKPEVQNLFHIPLFAPLSFLWLMCYRRRGHSLKRSFLFALSITISYAFFDELHQYYIPGRFTSITDIGFDLIGAAIGVIAYSCLRAFSYVALTI